MYKLEELFQPGGVAHISGRRPSDEVYLYAAGDTRVYHGTGAFLTELGEQVFIMAGCEIRYDPPYNCGIKVPDHLIRALTGGRDV